jgi:hypothetical protein
MSLRGNPIIEMARLPDGREARIRVGIAEDPYIADKDSTTVVLEVRIGRGVVAVIDTILEPDQVDAAHHLANHVRDGLGSGELEPKTSALERLADEIL